MSKYDFFDEKTRVDFPEDMESYYTLANVFNAAFEQAAFGKGHERHAEEDIEFHKQPIMEICEKLGGPQFALGQAMKKIEESGRINELKDTDACIDELLGAINYIAAAILYYNKHQEEPKGKIERKIVITDEGAPDPNDFDDVWDYMANYKKWVKGKKEKEDKFYEENKDVIDACNSLCDLARTKFPDDFEGFKEYVDKVNDAMKSHWDAVSEPRKVERTRPSRKRRYYHRPYFFRRFFLL